MKRRTIREQKARTRELDALRLQRPLADAERQEADKLASQEYMRVYNAL